MALHFDEATHTFTRDGVVVPSVTQILARCGLTSKWWTEAARQRGSRVHRALYELQRTSEDAALFQLEDEDEPFYRAGVRALETFGIRVLAAEELVDGGDYAGWLDLRCELRGCEDPFVIDFKSGQPPAYTGLQLTGYAKPQPKQHRRAVIRLQANGEPKMFQCLDVIGDLRKWNACVTVAHMQIALENSSHV